jgi:ATP-dependent DNA helicase DinG
VAEEAVQHRLLRVEIPRLCESMRISKPIRTGDRWPSPEFQGVLLTTPTDWLADHCHQSGRFPAAIPTVLDGAEALEHLTRQQMTVSLIPQDWEALMLTYPQQAEAIRDHRVRLTKALFQHPPNPYGCALIDQPEREILFQLGQVLQSWNLHLSPNNWQSFWQLLARNDYLFWAEIDREWGQFTLNTAPIDLSPVLSGLWSRQPLVLLGSGLDLEVNASLYRKQIGLGDLTCLKFAPDRQQEVIQLYLPEQMPMPNTPEFQTALLAQIRQLLSTSSGAGLTVLIVEDLPLRGQIGAILAAEYGSRVQVETLSVEGNGVLVTGWQFWQQSQQRLPFPHLLAIATLPLPSPEDPRVAGRVAYHKRLRQDWFRLYLLPQALSTLERAIAPVRGTSAMVAILDPRVVHRSYGEQVLSVLSPYVRINYLSPHLFAANEYLVQDL